MYWDNQPNPRSKKKPAPVVHKPTFEEQVEAKTQASKQRDIQSRGEGREYARDVLSQEYPGLTHNQRKAMEQEQELRIHRAHQSTARRLLGDQSRRGITPKSGVAFAQQRDLQRLADDQRGQVHRDIEKLNADLALKKLGAGFGIEQGQVSQSQLNRQMAEDELKLESDKKRQRSFEDKFNKYLFSRI